MTQAQLAAASGVALITISRFEQGTQIPREKTLHALRHALELRGIEFLNGGSPGVRLHPDRAVIPGG